jgi:hypothetical protein
MMVVNVINKMNLDEFIAVASKKSYASNAYVDEPGFSALYVRLTKRYINDNFINTIDLANIAAENPGDGAFTRLVKRLKKQHPALTIYVESVLNPRFERKLLSMGFAEVPSYYGCHSYYLLPEKDLI